jgi:hypothetical protein
MIKYLFVFLLTFIMVIELPAQKKVDFKLKFKEFEIKNTSIRAIQVINDSIVWFTGSEGKYGRIINDSLQMDSLSFKGKLLNFRSIAFNGKNIYILSIENPAILLKINPFKMDLSEPEIVYREDHASVFYDSMTFLDEKNGIAMGDPTENCFSVIITSDGGNTWNKLSCNNIPDSFKGEAAFAASNGNIATFGKNVWMVSGGKKARVFYSNDKGKYWNVVETPIIQGGKMTGIYTVDFYDKNNGIIMGGNWEEKSSTNKTKAITSDGGKTWQLIAGEQIPGYISSVRYVPKSKGKEIIAVSTEGIYRSSDKGNSWKKINDQGFYSIRFINKNSAWLSGINKLVKINFE